jgi:serine/threonine protein kinase
MSQIGRYTIVKQTGIHALATMYEAFDPVMNRPVNIRVATNPGVSETETPAQFDSRQLHGLDHPNIVKILAWEEDQDRPYMVLEQFEGQPLSLLLAGGSSLAPEKVAQILKNAASALDHLHSKGLIHRNLTPERVLVGEDSQLKLDGCEMARFVSSEERIENPEELIGSIAYLAPEFLKGDALEPRSDQFSLAVIVFQALTGELPFRANSPIGVMRQVAFENPDLSAANRIPRAAANAIVRALSKKPSGRFNSCAEFASSFEAGLSSRAAAATRMAPSVVEYVPPAALSQPKGPDNQNLVRKVLIGGTVVALLLLALALWLLRREPAPDSRNTPAVVVPATPTVKTTPGTSVQTPPPAAAPKAVKPPPVAIKKKAPEPTPEPPPEEPPKLRPVEPKVVQP